jgi:hypothetical protein
MAMRESTSAELRQLIRDVIKRKRQYAGFWTWPDREVAELGVDRDLLESIARESGNKAWKVRSRGAGNDPPDCEATDEHGNRIGIEVTELVDQRHAGGESTNWAEWDELKTRAYVAERLARKDDSSQLNGGPYHHYYVILFTDEPMLPARRLRELLQHATFGPFRLIDGAWVLASYEPGEAVPHVALKISQTS